jgi:trinucleotide repeat-containing gene 6 protein
MKPVGQKKMISSESIWSSKQYRVLVDMGCRKEDAEFALRSTSGNLEDAIELLNSNGRIRDQGNMFGQDSGNMFDQQRRFPGMPNSGGVQNAYSQDGGQMGYKMPNTMSQPRQPQQQQPQQPPSSQPSAQQLRILVQQIQMAVQAGHLNPQILNQPLAPQTLISLNQLLQQIKTLQTLQQQHSMAQSQKPMGGNSSGLLAVSVNITKTKQNIQNLQNQISAQQAAYLKSQQMPSAPHQGMSGSSSFEHGMPDIFGNYGGQPSGHVESHLPANRSRLNLWKLPEDGSAFSKAPGASSAGPGKPGNPSGLPFDDNPWTPSGSNSGWPETSKTSSGLSGGDSVSNGLDSFGIPEFEPGKPWKGPGMKNPDEDPNLTPGSMAQPPIDMNALSKATSNVNLQSSSNSDNSLGLTQSTWSFGGSGSEIKGNSSKADAWNGPSLSSTSSSSNLTPMGQDLWGKSGTGRTPPGLSGNDGGSGWPSSNGWNGSNSQNGAGNDNGNMMNGSNGQCWLLLKNLTPQIDGLTLKTLCMQHGPLKQFQLILNHSIALVMYSSGREAQKVIHYFCCFLIFFWHFVLY